MIRAAIVGAGNIGGIHARCYGASGRASVVGVVDVVREKAERLAAQHGARAFGSVEELLASGVEVGTASVTTAGVENGSHHYAPTMELLGAGIAVLGEKPISNEIAEAREMVAFAKSKGVPYGINLNHRFTPAAELAKHWVLDGRVGEINIVNMTLWINNPNESSPHFHIRALHPHSIDVMRFFGGDVAKVQAFFKKGKGRAIWSNVQVNMLFTSGGLGHLTGSYDAGGAFGLERCEVAGSDGRFVIEDACERLTFHPRNSREVEVHDHPGGMGTFSETFQSRIDAWLKDLENATPRDRIEGRAEDALAAQEVIEAAIASWETGSVVDVS